MLRYIILGGALGAACSPIPGEPAPDRTLESPIALDIIDDRMILTIRHADLHEESAKDWTLDSFEIKSTGELIPLPDMQVNANESLVNEDPPSVMGTYVTSQTGVKLVAALLATQSFGFYKEMYLEVGPSEPYAWMPLSPLAATTVAGHVLAWSKSVERPHGDYFSGSSRSWGLFDITTTPTLVRENTVSLSCFGARCATVSLPGQQLVWSYFDVTAETFAFSPVTFIAVAEQPERIVDGAPRGFRGTAQCKTPNGDFILVGNLAYSVTDPSVKPRNIAALYDVKFNGVFICSATSIQNEGLWIDDEGNMTAVHLNTGASRSLALRIPRIPDWRYISGSQTVLAAPLAKGGWVIASGIATKTEYVSQCDYYPSFERCDVPYSHIGTKIWIIDEDGNEEHAVLVGR